MSHRAITCHLQTSGYTVVLGSDKDTVNKVTSCSCCLYWMPVSSIVVYVLMWEIFLLMQTLNYKLCTCACRCKCTMWDQLHYLNLSSSYTSCTCARGIAISSVHLSLSSKIALPGDLYRHPEWLISIIIELLEKLSCLCLKGTWALLLITPTYSIDYIVC